MKLPMTKAQLDQAISALDFYEPHAARERAAKKRLRAKLYAAFVAFERKVKP